VPTCIAERLARATLNLTDLRHCIKAQLQHSATAGRDVDTSEKKQKGGPIRSVGRAAEDFRLSSGSRKLSERPRRDRKLSRPEALRRGR
jgi:hypothetical protein